MEYVQHIVDRATGNLVEIGTGNWITITELGESKGVSARKVRTILREMDFLYVEGGRAHNRHRLSPWVIQQGYGKHIPARKPGVRYPFDVISPTGQTWIETRWPETVAALDARPHRLVVVQARDALNTFIAGRLGALNVPGSVRWLRDHFDDLSDTEIACILEVSQQMVSEYARVQEKQRRCKKLRLRSELPDLGKVRLSPYREDETDYPQAEALASGGAEVYYPSPQPAGKRTERRL